jgi:uncharacterized protein
MPITQKDILVVAPYNLQVNLLKQLLPEGAQIGTVDKFQGQEAAIVSMTTSRGTEAPRGTEFLFNPNRFNVAVSPKARVCLILRALRIQASGAASHTQQPREPHSAKAEPQDPRSAAITNAASRIVPMSKPKVHFCDMTRSPYIK